MSLRCRHSEFNPAEGHAFDSGTKFLETILTHDRRNVAVYPEKNNALLQAGKR